MKSTFIHPLLVGLFLMAIGTGAKSQLDIAALERDVAVLEAKQTGMVELLKEVRTDVKLLLGKAN